MALIGGGATSAQLGQTNDPTQLVPGNPEVVNETAATLTAHGERMETVAHDLGRVETPHWTGAASDAFWDKFSGEKPNWLKGSDALSSAAKALTRYADVLTWAQSQAKEAIEIWERGEAATEKAVADYNSAHAGEAADTGADEDAARPPFSDPGEKLRENAQEILDRARRQLSDAARTAAEAIRECGGKGADAPSWLSHAASVVDKAVEEHGLGGITVGGDPLMGDSGIVGDDDKRTWGTPGEDGKPTGPDWQVMLAEVSGDAYLWDGKVEGETELAGATLAGSAGLQTLGVEGKAGLSVTGEGLTAELKGGAYLAKATAEGSAQYGILGANAKGEAYVGAEAGAKASIGTQGVHVGAEAFAGAKAEGSVGADVGGIGAGVKGEAWAGIGAEADATIGMEGGKFTIGGEVGAALGVGGNVGFEVTVDVGEVADTASDAADAVGDALGDAGDALSSLNPF